MCPIQTKAFDKLFNKSKSLFFKVTGKINTLKEGTPKIIWNSTQQKWFNKS